jgi:hypothetical protein
VFSIAVVDGDGDYTYLLDKDVNFIREAFPRSSTQGLPQFYGQFDGDDTVGSGNFILGPTPDASYSSGAALLLRPSIHRHHWHIVAWGQCGGCTLVWRSS